MKIKPKILIAEPKDFSNEVIKKLKKHAKVEVKECRESDLKNILEDYDVLWFRLGYRIDRKLLENPNNKCKIIAVPATGIDHIDEECCQELGIKIICLRGELKFLKTVRATAELTLGLTLSLLRNISSASLSVKEGIWNRDLFRGNELYGKTAGIIGYGRLGEIVSNYFLAMGMEVVAYDVRPVKPAAGVELTKSIKDLVKRSDVISVHVNYNKSNHHLIGEDIFKAFKAGSIFLNTSRGGIVDEKALLKALRNGWVKGAALDVLQNEPNISKNNPLIKYSLKNNNLLIVPHIGGNTYESFQKTEAFIADKIIKTIHKGI